MAFHSVLAVAVGEGLRHLPRTPTKFAVAAVFIIGGALLLRGGTSDDHVRAVAVHSAWGVIGRTALIIGIAEFGDFTQLATVGNRRRSRLPGGCCCRVTRRSHHRRGSCGAGWHLAAKTPACQHRSPLGGCVVLGFRAGHCNLGDPWLTSR
jgi:hypothetical protein